MTGSPDTSLPRLLHTVLDSTDVRGLAEFYRRLMGLVYRPGDEVPDDRPDDADWLVLLDQTGARVLAVQQVEHLEPSTWPSDEVPMQLHLDLAVPDVASLQAQRLRAEQLGARLLRDRRNDPEEPLQVLADPAGHPFCLLVAAPEGT